MFRITEVVKNLLIINILMFFATRMLMGDYPMYVTDFSSLGRLKLAMFYPTSEYFRPYQIITHMFMHADFSHLFFNMFALFMFGPPLESLWGPKRFLYYYLACGFGALGLHMIVKFIEMNYLGGPSFINIPMLGASGAVFGILAGFGIKFPDTRIMLLFPPIPMKARVFVLIYAGLELFLGLGPFNTGIAHFAHLGGALFGFLLIQYWDKYAKRF